MFLGGPPKVLFTLALAYISTLASAHLAPYVIHERRTHTPQGWSLSRRHNPSAILPVRFGLKQSNLHSLEEYLFGVSHPSSTNYGKHWTSDQVASAFAPSDETIDVVRSWLVESGIALERIQLSPSKGWIQVDMTVEEAENLISTEYHIYTHETGKEHIACDEYHLPLHVASHVELVSPSVHFNAMIKKRSSNYSPKRARKADQPKFITGPKIRPTLSSDSTNNEGYNYTCAEQIVPDCLRTLYNISYTPVSGSSNSFAIVEYTPQAYLQSDLDLFFESYAPDLVGKPPFEVDIDGGFQQTGDESSDYNLEPALDLQYAMTLVTSAQNVTLYQVGDNVEAASFNNFLDALDGSYCTYEGGDDPSVDQPYPDPQPGGYTGPAACGTVKPASVISTSYIYNEADLTAAYAIRQCNEYAKLGLMGVTVLYPSGDDGVGGDNEQCLGDGTIFSPTFPATCPYITSVGATQLLLSDTDPEVAIFDFIVRSGGGFSNYFAVPDYQRSDVQSFLNSTSTDKTLFNSTGNSRAYPDVSANGAGYLVAIDGEFTWVDGTSASTPVLGVMITLVNDARLAAGKAPVGFINPTIYDPSFASVFNDITSGTNSGCGTEGFSCDVGWDPVTGLGTVNFGLLKEAYLALA